jgi:hypothetical protein
MFRRFRAAPPLAAAAAVLLTSACATTARMPGADRRPNAVILIDNEANYLTEMTVTLIPQFGVPRVLGTVRHNEKKTFVVKEAMTGASYQLLARPLGGRQMLSTPFSLSAGDRFEWDLRMNDVFFRGRDLALR